MKKGKWEKKVGLSVVENAKKEKRKPKRKEKIEK